MASKGSVLVAMSGGVDSSVAACLLAEQGYEVIGSHMRLVHLDGVEHGCCGPAARADAEAVARIGGFPFEIAEMTAEFEQRVIADFVAEHEAGRTPNPCARCNGEIKFGAFLRRADELGVDMVATGHYVRSDRSDVTAPGICAAVRTAAKDQSYMLHMLGQRQLARSLFPVGACRSARRGRTPSGSAFRSRRSPTRRSSASPRAAMPAGSCDRRRRPSCTRGARSSTPTAGSSASTTARSGSRSGQRRGLGVAVGEPAYVLEVDAAHNRVVVGPQELLSRRGLVADRASWVAGDTPGDGPFEADVRIRYRGDDVPSVVEATPTGFRVEFREPQRAIAPGQAAVVYRGDELLGGGRIVESLR